MKNLFLIIDLDHLICKDQKLILFFWEFFYLWRTFCP